jgi:predicted nucleic-acid-binding protein
VIAIDTNILVRVIMSDDAEQVAQAKQLMSNNVCYVTRSVVQEVVWVLGRSYKLKREQIVAVVEGLIASQHVVLEDEPSLLQAVSWFRQGFDFADALHLATAGTATSLATFDQAFIKAAQIAQTPIPVTHPK